MPEPYTLHLDRPENNGRRFVIADIHGCFYTFQSLVKKLNLTADDHLFILGDMINRGKRSQYVIDFILQLYVAGYKVFPLQGNHEHVVINNCIDNPGLLSTAEKKTGSISAFLNKGSIKPEYDVFFRTLPHCILSGEDLVFSHAGLNFEHQPLTDYASMLVTRQFTYNAQSVNGRRLMHGHTPINLENIREAIDNRSPVINLDNGCVMKNKKPEKGNLICLDADSMELYIQKNID